ncbi:MAG: SIMPL domain-containing protein, partial [Bacteroidota bacterium]
TVSAQAQPPVRTINVTGTGKVDLSPDMAYIYLGVHTEDPKASEAVTANNAQTQKVIAALKKLGIADKDIRTTNFSIWPSQNYTPDGQPLETKYVVDNTVYVTIRKLDQLGDLLDSVIAAGVNTVNSIQFDVADKEEALKQARAEAVKDGQKQAKELADAAGIKLGSLYSIGFSEAVTPLYDYGKGGGGAAPAAAQVPIQPGQLTISAMVNLSYEIGQ